MVEVGLPVRSRGSAAAPPSACCSMRSPSDVLKRDHRQPRSVGAASIPQRYDRRLAENPPSDAVRPSPSTGAVTECDTPDPAASFEAMTALRGTRRKRRLGDVVWGDLAYRVYTTALASLVLVIFASGFVGDQELSASAVATVTADGPAWVGLFVASLVVLGLRSGLRSGPIALEGADVHHLLLAPVDRSAVLRRPVSGMVGYGAAGAALLGALVGALCAQRLPGSSSSWLLSGALFGLTCATLTLGTGLVTASRRVRRPILDLVVAALWLWSLLDAIDVVPDAPLSFVGSMLLWPLDVELVAALGTVLGIVLVVVGALIVGGLSIEAARRRTAAGGPAPLRGDPAGPPVGHAAAPPARGRATAQPATHPAPPPVHRAVPGVRPGPPEPAALADGPHRPRAWCCASAPALALRGVWDGTTPLVLVAGIAGYVAALDAIEPLAQEIDHPTTAGARTPIAQGMILVRHLVAPGPGADRDGHRRPRPSPGRSAPTVEVAHGRGDHAASTRSVAAVAGASISVVSEAVLDQTGAAMMPPEVAGPRVVCGRCGRRWSPSSAAAGARRTAGRCETAGPGASPSPQRSPVPRWCSRRSCSRGCGTARSCTRRWDRPMRGETPGTPAHRGDTRRESTQRWWFPPGGTTDPGDRGASTWCKHYGELVALAGRAPRRSRRASRSCSSGTTDRASRRC